ncbi:MAG: YabP/YqfC family sporulation protein [Lachnospiraceae bacterium]|mgnify:FL=1|nr:YabP/YqfC family sporulation protein [Lachnospiraceae bacterium]
MMKKVKSGPKQQLHRGKELVVESLKLPRDSVLGDSIITVTGNTEILIENYKGILQYSDELILLQGKNRKIELKGKRLNIVYYTNEDMKISGMIESICFI